MRDKLGRFIKGIRSSPATQFKKGHHWRKPQPFRDKTWLEREYGERQRSTSHIAAEFGVTDGAIQFWLKKHGIRSRSIAEARKAHHWTTPSGPKNPMFGRRGVLSPTWRGGNTPLRQKIYSTLDWKKFAAAVRKRDKTCRLCGSNERLEIHHIEPFSLAPLLVMFLGNAILLCHTCHRKLFGKERRWRNRLLKIIHDEPKAKL